MWVEVGGVDLGPCLNYWKDGMCGHVGEREVVFGREGDNIAFPCRAFCS